MNDDFTFKILPIGSDFTVTLLPSLPQTLPDQVIDQIETVWQQESRKSDRLLFDGILLSANDYDAQGMKGHFISYKQYLAWKRLPEIHAYLDIHPVGIIGLTFCGKKLLIGKRSSNMAQAPGKYECAPAGGMDAGYMEHKTILFREQLLAELEEETGIERGDVVQIKPYLLVERTSASCGAVELISWITLHNLQPHQLRPTPEYSELFWLEPEELKDFLSSNKDDFLPTSRLLIEQLVACPQDLSGA